jgi:hypothetical protein
MLYDMARTFSLTRHRRFFTRVLTQHRFLMLSLFLLATLIAYPYTEGRSSRFYAFRVLSGLIIALSVYVVSFRRGLAIIAIVLAIPAMVQRVLNPSLTPGFWPVGNLILSFTDFSPGV